LVEDRLEKAAGVGLSGGELGLQVVVESHQFVLFGDDAMLFG
jgi:hypothetical protein